MMSPNSRMTMKAAETGMDDSPSKKPPLKSILKNTTSSNPADQEFFIPVGMMTGVKE